MKIKSNNKPTQANKYTYLCIYIDRQTKGREQKMTRKKKDQS